MDAWRYPFYVMVYITKKCPTAAVPTVGMSQCASNRFSGTKEKKQIKLEKEKQQNSKKKKPKLFALLVIQYSKLYKHVITNKTVIACL